MNRFLTLHSTFFTCTLWVVTFSSVNWLTFIVILMSDQCPEVRKHPGLFNHEKCITVLTCCHNGSENDSQNLHGVSRIGPEQEKQRLRLLKINQTPPESKALVRQRNLISTAIGSSKPTNESAAE